MKTAIPYKMHETQCVGGNYEATYRPCQFGRLTAMERVFLEQRGLLDEYLAPGDYVPTRPEDVLVVSPRKPSTAQSARPPKHDLTDYAGWLAAQRKEAQCRPHDAAVQVKYTPGAARVTGFSSR